VARFGVERCKDLKAAGLRARVDLRHTMYGSAARIISDAAKEHGAGLIMMSCWPLRSCRLLLGSVAHKVLHLSACPVLMAR
jgi:nucleotide-binding universal stress UspA family protein